MGHGYYVSAKQEQRADYIHHLRMLLAKPDKPPVVPRSHGRILKVGEN